MAVPAADGGSRAAAVVGIVCGVLVLLWYVGIFATGGLLFIFLQSLYQVVVWVLALISVVCGLLALRGRRGGLTTTAVVVGSLAFVVAVAVGILTGFRIIVQ